MRKKVEEIIKEIGAITWPTREKVVNNSVIVLIALIVSAVFIALLDRMFFGGFEYLISTLQG